MEPDKKKKPVAPVSYDARKEDPQGSYTGKPTDPKDTPVQDADDL